MDAKGLDANREAWNIVAEKFYGHSALPNWGPFDVASDTNLIGIIEDKTFLEIGCGSGHSIKYLIEHGAKKVYGLDFSTTQLDYARSVNGDAVLNKNVELFESSMEEKIHIEPVDLVYSIYALGWTLQPEKTLKNVFEYLKPGGVFIWSWDHSFFSDVEDQKSHLAVVHSYHDEGVITRKNWKGGEASISMRYLKTSSWFKLLTEAGFMVVNYLEPAPVLKEDYTSNYYTLRKAENIPCSMIWVCQKPTLVRL